MPVRDMSLRLLLSALGVSLAFDALAQTPQTPSVSRITITGSGSTGDLSGACTSARPGAPCRPLSSRSAEEASVLDRNADPTGSADSRASFSSAASDALASKSAISVPPGSYRLTAPFEPPIGVPFFARGASMTPGTFANIGDLTKYPTYTFFKSSNSPDTDNAVNIGFITRGSPAGVNYQKSGLFIRATTYDSGSCTGSPLSGCKDIVALTATGNVADGTSNGRAYGANLTAGLGAGSTGVAAGYEVDVYNQTGIDHTADFYTGSGGGGKSSIVGSTVVCGGNAPCDAAYYVSSLNPAQAKFSTALRVLRGHVRDYVLEVNDDTSGNLLNRTAWIKPDGSARFAALSTTAGLSVTGTATFGGSASFSGGLFSAGATMAGTGGAGSLTLGGGSGSVASTVSTTSGDLALYAGSGRTLLGTAASLPTIPSAPPASAGASCKAGATTFDTSYLYICIADNNWKRAALASW